MKTLHLVLLAAFTLACPSLASAQTNADQGASSASGGAGSAPVALPTPESVPESAAPKPARQWLKAVYEQVVDSVVLIETEYGTGSGFFFHGPRLIGTALHVVDDADQIVVETNNGTRKQGRVVAYSRKYDLALVELESAVPGARALEPAAGLLEIGQPVVVVGHPFSGLEYQVHELRGLLNWSMTQGVVSAVAGSWLQTDAAINPGNSGGPIVDERGQLLGVVSATLSHAQGISLAARVGRLTELLPKIGSQPPPRHTWLVDRTELGFVVQAASDVIQGVSLGAGMRIVKRFPVRLRLGLLAGSVEPSRPDVVATRLVRGLAELSGGYALSLGAFELSPYLGGAFYYDHERDSALRIDSTTPCPTPPCLVNGKVVSSSQGRARLLPMAGASLDFGQLRLDYAYQLAIEQAIDSQHRVLVAFTF
jgi:S1-C subfamily serine protease